MQMLLYGVVGFYDAGSYRGGRSIVVVTRRVGGVCIVVDSQGRDGESEGHKVKI